MPFFYKGHIRFDKPLSPAEFNVARKFFKENYHFDPFDITEEAVLPIRSVSFYLTTDAVCRIEKPKWAKELVRECNADDEAHELDMLFLSEAMENLFGGRVFFERFFPTIDNVEELEKITRFWQHNAGRGRSPYRAESKSETEGIGEHLFPDGEQSLAAALTELDALIGLETVKQQIHDIVAVVQNRGVKNLPCLHMVFTGNPGTGKTEIARKLGRVLAALGVIKSNGLFVEADRSTLVGQFIGHTAQKTKAVIEKAQGGVLFIDEAYSLGTYANDLGAGPDGLGGRRDFGPEAIDALVKEMEDHRSNFVCIMAGYPREMEYMISANPGLRDRIGFKIEFPDYTGDELGQIFEKMVSDKGYSLETAARWLALDNIEAIERSKGQDFGNARLIRKLAERTIFKQNVRTGGYDICSEDVRNAFKDMDLADLLQEQAQPFGFCA